jgi:transcription-repair coupling factor (superfamily II helicase)
MDAYIDSSYIKNEIQKLNAYKRIASIESKGDKEDVLEELIDRYGEPGAELLNLLTISYMRSMASKTGIIKVTQQDTAITLTYMPGAKIDFERLSMEIQKYRGKCILSAGASAALIFQVKGYSNAAALDLICRFLENIL